MQRFCFFNERGGIDVVLRILSVFLTEKNPKNRHCIAAQNFCMS